MGRKQLSESQKQAKEPPPELVSRTNRFNLVATILVRYRGEPKTAAGIMGKGFKWYFVVPEGFLEGVFRGVRKALEMPFFASKGHKKRPALSSRSYDFYGTPRENGRVSNYHPKKTASRPEKHFPVSPAAAVSSAHKSPQVVPDGTSHSGKCEPDSVIHPLHIYNKVLPPFPRQIQHDTGRVPKAFS